MGTKATVISDPEVVFFQNLPGAPWAEKLPRTVGGMLRLKGLSNRANLIGSVQDEYWKTWLAKVPGAQAWWDSPKSLVPPEYWPEDIAMNIPEHISPSVWIDHITPWGKGILGIRAWGPPGLGAISAHALGWELTGAQVRAGAAAASDLMTIPQYVVWAYDLDLDGIPMPFNSKVSLAQKLQARERLQAKPLLAGTVSVRRALPEFMWSTSNLLVHCPRRSKGVSRTGKYALTRRWVRHKGGVPRR